MTKVTKSEKQATDVAVIRDDLIARLNIDSETGIITPTDEAAADDDYTYVKHLPEGLTAGHVKAVNDYNINFAAAAAGAIALKAAGAFNANADLKQVNYEVGMHHKDKVQVMASRENGLSVAVVTSVVNAKSGPMKAVFASFNEAMEAAAE